jgi:hypothetical protein
LTAVSTGSNSKASEAVTLISDLSRAICAGLSMKGVVANRGYYTICAGI